MDSPAFGEITPEQLATWSNLMVMLDPIDFADDLDTGVLADAVQVLGTPGFSRLRFDPGD